MARCDALQRQCIRGAGVELTREEEVRAQAFG